MLAPGGRFVWASRLRDGWWNEVGVEDTEGAMQYRVFSEPVRRLSVRPLVGLDQPRVLMVRDRGHLTVYEARGVAVGPTVEGLPALLLGVVVHPSGKGASWR